MNISVIIPVYNAGQFVERAVTSALQQQETSEIILVEDGSSDNSLDICKKLSNNDDRIKLFRHPGGRNMGAAESRNLGIKMAGCELVAFLDADDYYLSNRFKTVKNILANDTSIDGVYEAIGMHFYDIEAKQKWLSMGGELLTTMEKGIKPENLFVQLIIGSKGYIHLDGLVVKRKIFDKCGYFFSDLKLHQDTAILIQLSAFGLLVPGELDQPVALRGIHAQNRITNNPKALFTRQLLWSTLFEWAKSSSLSTIRVSLLYKRLIETTYQLEKRQHTDNRKLPYKVRFILSSFLAEPSFFLIAMLFSLRYIKSISS